MGYPTAPVALAIAFVGLLGMPPVATVGHPVAIQFQTEAVVLESTPASPVIEPRQLGGLPPFGALFGPIKTLDMLNGTLLSGNYVPTSLRFPSGVAEGLNGGTAYVTGWASNNVVMLNSTNGRVLGWIPVGAGPSTIVYDGRHASFYTTNSANGSLSVINSRTNSVVATISLGSGVRPIDLAIDDKDDTLFVAGNGGVWVVNASTDKVVRVIGLNMSTTSITYDAFHDYVYVDANNCGGSGPCDYVSIINASSESVLDTVAPSGRGYGTPLYGTYDANSHQVYVADGATLNVFNGLTIVAKLNVGSIGSGEYCYLICGQAISWNPSDDHIFALNGSVGGVIEINASNNSIVRTIPVATPQGWPAVGLYTGAAGILVLSGAGLSLIPLGSQSVTKRVPLEYDPGAVLYDPDNADLYVTNGVSELPGEAPVPPSHYLLADNVTVLSTASAALVDSVSVPLPGNRFGGLAFASGLHEIAVASMADDNSTIINTTSDLVATSFATNASEADVTYDVATQQFLIAMWGKGIEVVNATTNTVCWLCTVGSVPSPTGIAYSGRAGDIYIANTSIYPPTHHDLVTINQSTHVSSTLSLGVEESAATVTYDPVNGQLYVINRPVCGSFVCNGSYSLDVVGEARVMAHLPFQSNPARLAANPVTGDVYISFNETGVVTVVRNTTIIGNLNVGAQPQGIAFAPNGTAYVANQWSGTITIIPLSADYWYPVVFSESGLPPGTLWSVSMGMYSESSITPQLTFYVGNGTFDFTIGETSGYLPTPSSGAVSVSGSNGFLIINFTRATFLGLSGIEGYALLAGFFAAGLGSGIGAMLWRGRKIKNQILLRDPPG